MISFSPFRVQDINAILAIERLAYKAPWSKVQFTQSLDNPNVLATLISKNEQVLGYSIALRSLDSIDLLNICIHPDYQQQGLGTQLFNKLCVTGVKDIFIEVRCSNHSALSFYKKLGFNIINIRKQYYCDGEDAKILRFSISS
ncbi:MAG: ribosomal protein S18-alanine N-acetyltransferase [Gammaproteobacteria bacterium]|nr:ribosomal protein S18-alanine N-acetyltransferase [Gammaproteobacteria bacterium]